jgi:hypothetical protein
MHMQLQKPRVDPEECFCPLGCCREVAYVSDSLSYTPFTKSFPSRLEILGCENEAEKELIRTRLAAANGGGTSAFIFIHDAEKDEGKGDADPGN